MRVRLELPDAEVGCADRSDHDVCAPLGPMLERTCVIFRSGCGFEPRYLRGACQETTELADFGEQVLHTIFIQDNHSGEVVLLVCVLLLQHKDEFRVEVMSTWCTIRWYIDGLVR